MSKKWLLIVGAAIFFSALSFYLSYGSLFTSSDVPPGFLIFIGISFLLGIFFLIGLIWVFVKIFQKSFKNEAQPIRNIPVEPINSAPQSAIGGSAFNQNTTPQVVIDDTKPKLKLRFFRFVFLSSLIIFVLFAITLFIGGAMGDDTSPGAQTRFLSEYFDYMRSFVLYGILPINMFALVLDILSVVLMKIWLKVGIILSILGTIMSVSGSLSGQTDQKLTFGFVLTSLIIFGVLGSMIGYFIQLFKKYYSRK